MPIPDPSELAILKRQAERLAHERRETATSAHLLAAMACHVGPVAELFRERRLALEGLLRAARAASDDENEPLKRACGAARQVAERMRAPQPAALHLLIALLSRRQTAAYRALDQLGVDLSRLRLAAMNLCLGQLGRQPIQSSAEARRRPREAEAATPTASPRSRAGGARLPRAEVVSLQDLREQRRPSDPVPSSPTAASLPPPTMTSAAQPPPTRARSEAAPQPMPSEVGISKLERESAPGARRLLRDGGVRPARAVDEAHFVLSKKDFPILSEIGRNLTLLGAQGRLGRIVCRDQEVDRVLDVLAKQHSNNPCLVGVAGVGKTRLVHGVALRTAGYVPGSCRDGRIVVEVTAAALVAGTAMRGGLAQRMAGIERELAQAHGRVVIFFDEIHTLFTGDGGEELVSEFKRAVSSGALSCLGATTPAEYARAIEADPALVRRFTRLDVEEPSRDEALAVIKAVAPEFEAYHGVRYSAAALEAAVGWTHKFVRERALPDKALAALDWSAARVSRRGGQVVDREQLAQVVGEVAHVPPERLLESDGARLLRLEAALAERVVGHETSLSTIAQSIRRNAAGLGGKRPIGAFLLLGPTGVGKTETAKALASALFFSEEALTRIDLSEYSEAHTVARLLGAPPGYVGHEAGGQLTEAVRRRPYQVLLLDEFEKAHEDVHQSLLALLDEGRMTDGRGRTVDFTHTVILMTSNLGASSMATERTVGFQRGGGAAADRGYRDRLLDKARQALAPELFNRIDEVLVYQPLTEAQVRLIGARMLQRLAARLKVSRELLLEWRPCVIEALIAGGGVDLSLGARPMQRTVSRLVETPLAERLLRGNLQRGDRVILSRGAAATSVSIEVERTEPARRPPANRDASAAASRTAPA